MNEGNMISTQSTPSPKSPPCPVQHAFRLYVAGGKPQSMQAVMNLTRLCEKYFKGCYDLEVIDIYKRRDVAQREGLLALPTLVRVAPEPRVRIIGDLSDEDGVLKDLGWFEMGEST